MSEKGCGPATVKEESESENCDLIPVVEPEGDQKFAKEIHLNHSSSQIEAERSFEDGSLVSEEEIELPKVVELPPKIDSPVISIGKTSPLLEYVS